MDNSLFFNSLDIDEKNKELIEQLSVYSERYSKQVYLIASPLGEAGNRYEYKEAAVLLVPKHKLCFINFDDEQDECFDEFCDDFIDDIGYLSDKYEYRTEIGRPRVWKNKLIEKKNSVDIIEIENTLQTLQVKTPKDERIVDYLISLLIGSINDINRVGGKLPETVLDQVKKKIILFDGEQSRFIYTPIAKKRITIQGLAGTGKTELLLHKLRDLYINKKNTRIVFTCYNNILAKSMRKRIPSFFNFMRVDEQIEWERRLWVMPSWGSGKIPDSGVYSYICDAYGIPFRAFSNSWPFDRVCREAIAILEAKPKIEPCFDYILIDESQDFAESFLKLCELVSKEKIYVAGDIFQDIYDRNFSNSVNSDYLLNKCYRTDPRTLMFAHAIGMGIYEKPVLRWLEDAEWQACGYSLSRFKGKIKFTRQPLRRFEDLDTEGIDSICVYDTNDDILKKVVYTIDTIKEKHPTVEPQDIAIVFLEGYKNDNYTLADTIAVTIKRSFGWKSIKGYETKENSGDALFISNRNNIKGLEFPFVICIVNSTISDDIYSRNTLYMMLTRSFITSYLIINNDGMFIRNDKFINIYKKAAAQIQQNACIEIEEPDEREKRMQNQKISIVSSKKKLSLRDIVNNVLLQYPTLSESSRNSIVSAVVKLRNEKEESITDEEIEMMAHKLARTFGEIQ